MSEHQPLEPKFKPGDKVQTNELFNMEHTGPGFKGIVTSLNPAYYMKGTDNEVVTLHAEVETWKTHVNINQDYLEIYYGDLGKDEPLLKTVREMENEVLKAKDTIANLNNQLDNVLEHIRRMMND